MERPRGLLCVGAVQNVHSSINYRRYKALEKISRVYDLAFGARSGREAEGASTER